MPRKVVYVWFGDSWCVTIKNNKTLSIYSVILMPSLLLPATLDSNCKCRLFHNCVHHEMIYCISQYSCRGPKLYELPEVKLGVDLSKWLMNNCAMFKPLKLLVDDGLFSFIKVIWGSGWGSPSVSCQLITVNNEPCKAYLFIYDQIFS